MLKVGMLPELTREVSSAAGRPAAAPRRRPAPGAAKSPWACCCWAAGDRETPHSFSAPWHDAAIVVAHSPVARLNPGSGREHLSIDQPRFQLQLRWPLGGSLECATICLTGGPPGVWL